ncbi:glycosyltransferase [Vibrio vulnificus]|nr:glycosyltransferase [Vibrio vulnificus]
MNSSDCVKRVVFYRPNLYSGGAERVIVNKANTFCEMGYSVHIVLLENRVEYDLDPRINLHIIGNSRLLIEENSISGRIIGNLRHLFNSLYICRQFKITLKAIENPNEELAAIFVHSSKSFLDLAFFTHPKKIIICHSNKSKLYQSSNYKYKNLIAVAIAKYVFSREKHISCVSLGIKEDLIERFGVDKLKTHVIPNPFSKEKIIELSKIAENEGVKNLASKKYLIHVGRLSREKRHFDLIEMFRHSKSFLTHSLIIVGEGPERQSIEHYISKHELTEKVILAGRMDNPYFLMANADLLILSSEYEGLPSVLIEASLLGVPCISSDCEFGPNVILKSNYLFPVGAVSIASKLIDKSIEIQHSTSHDNMDDLYDSVNVCKEYIRIVSEEFIK